MLRKRRRVAVVVFAEVEGYDDRAASTGAMLAVRQAVSPRLGLPADIRGRGASGEFGVTIHEVLPLGAAMDGYLTMQPTSRAYPPPDESPTW